jgi:2-polyprenyl-6-methoxyphenol hydroxylase-like FAD-dependent oxidoreductase
MAAPFSVNSSYDAIVIGARVAGAATALRLAHRGLRVLMIDRGRYGTDTVSTHALMRAGVLQLARWGVLPRVVAAGAPAITAATFCYGSDSLTVPIKPRDGIDALFAPRRTLLDRVLVDAAREAGVTVLFETVLTDVKRAPDGRVCGAAIRTADERQQLVRASFVVGADGRHSTVAQMVGAPVTVSGSSSSAIVYGYWRGWDRHEYRWYYGEGVSAGFIPTNDGQICVFASVASAEFTRWFRADIMAGYRAVLRKAAPDLDTLLDAGAAPERLRGFAGGSGYLRQASGEGWALVGDAAYFKDPLTAHGLTDALVEADYLATAIATSEAAVRAYAETRDERVRPLFEITDRVASFSWTLDEVRALHKQLAAAMTDEVNLLRAIAPEATIA